MTNMQTIRNDHALTQAAYETRARNHLNRLGGTTMWTRGYRSAWWDAIDWVLDMQMRFDELTVAEAVAELGKRDGSIYWPLKALDPCFSATCDRCRTDQLFDKRGICDGCGTHVEN